jgi:hypothetical protein
MRTLLLVGGLITTAVSGWAVPINYTFVFTTPAGPGSTLLVGSLEDVNVQIQLSALAGTVQITAPGAGVLSSPTDNLDIEGGDRLILTPVGFFGPFTFVSAVFGNVDTGPGNSGDQAIPYFDGVAGSVFILPVAPTAYVANAPFNSTLGFQNSDGNDNFRVQSIIIRGDASRLSGVPEPSTWTLLGAGVAGLACLRRRKRF